MQKCDICGKHANYANKVSHSRSHVSKRTKRKQKPNIQTMRIIENETPKKIRVCTKCMRTMKATKS